MDVMVGVVGDHVALSVSGRVVVLMSAERAESMSDELMHAAKVIRERPTAGYGTVRAADSQPGATEE